MATIEQLKPLQSFPSVEEMDQRISEFVTLNKHTISAARRKVLDYLRTHAVLVPGVCNASQRKIAVAIGVCKRTVMRAIDFFEECGLIEVKEQERESGATASHAFVFRPMSPAVSPAHVTPLHERSFTPLSTSQNEINKAECATLPSDLVDDSDFVPDYVPKLFAQQVSRILPAVAQIIDMWDVVRSAGRKLKREIPVLLAIKAFHHADYMRRRGRVKSSFNGLFKRTIEGMLTVEAQDVGGNATGDTLNTPRTASYEYDPAFAALYAGHGTEFIEDHAETPQINRFNEKYGDFYRLAGLEVCS